MEVIDRADAYVDVGGMSLRDWFAAHAPPMLDQYWKDSLSDGYHWLDADAAWRYEHADAMIKQRNTMKDSVILDEQAHDRARFPHRNSADARQLEARNINWTLRGEDRICNFTPEEKAEILRDMPDTALADIFSHLINVVGWNPHSTFAPALADSIPMRRAMNAIRAEQADLAEQEYIETGKEL